MVRSSETEGLPSPVSGALDLATSQRGLGLSNLRGGVSRSRRAFFGLHAANTKEQSLWQSWERLLGAVLLLLQSRRRWPRTLIEVLRSIPEEKMKEVKEVLEASFEVVDLDNDVIEN